MIILIKILPHFPVLAKLSQILERKVEKVREEERGQRQDLHVLATSYSGQLKAKTPNMIREADFHHVGDKVCLIFISFLFSLLKNQFLYLSNRLEKHKILQIVIIRIKLAMEYRVKKLQTATLG